MNVVRLVISHVNAVTVVALGGVAAGAVVAVLQDTEGAQAMDGGQWCFLLCYLSSLSEQIN